MGRVVSKKTSKKATHDSTGEMKARTRVVAVMPLTS